MTNARGIGENTDFADTESVMRFVVNNHVTSTANNGPIPSTLRTVPFPPGKSAPDKDFTFARNGDQWLVNGVGFSDVAHRILDRPARDTVEVWNLRNGGGGTHPVHIHLVDMQVLARSGAQRAVLPYERAGLKDTVYLSPGEYVAAAFPLLP